MRIRRMGLILFDVLKMEGRRCRDERGLCLFLFLASGTEAKEGEPGEAICL